MTAVEPFHLAIPQAELDDLRQRLDRARLPEPSPYEGWTQGVPLDRLRDLIAYWRDGYDWRRCEATLNGLGQHRTMIDGLGIHFLHVRSRHEGALPLLLTHGWPGSVIEFLKVIGPLTDPQAHGGQVGDAFHLVIPSLPGYGFSDKPREPGWGVERIARAWGVLMERLGYRRYVAQGGDWGSSVTVEMGVQQPAGLAGIHLNMLSVKPDVLDATLDEEEKVALAKLQVFANLESAYAREQATKPQTLGYALADSPVGQAAWIYEKFRTWSDCDGDPETVLTRDEMLDDIMLYWLSNSGASSGRLYFESMGSFRAKRVTLPVGFSAFPREIIPTPRKWADQVFPNIIHWNRLDKGGHFAAFEQPAAFAAELRACFARLR
jgi:pimeloyl-ACP methyl ester carboxylesterase